MGTNYYVRTNGCDKCERFDEVHIGKSSMGWTFSFRGYKSTLDPFGIIVSAKQWFRVLKDRAIYDEYGDEVRFSELKELVKVKAKEENNHADQYNDGNWIDDDGHSFSGTEFS